MKNQTTKDHMGMILRSVEGKGSQPLKSLAAHNRLTRLRGLEMKYKSKASTREHIGIIQWSGNKFHSLFNLGQCDQL
jgi:hypothetical protein